MPYTFLSFDATGAVRTEGLGIDENGQIVGFYVDAGGVTHGFRNSGGVFSTIDDPLGTATFAFGINDPGQIVGYYLDASQLAHGFLDSKGSFTTLDDPLAMRGTLAQGIAENGRIVGYYADGSGLDHGFLLDKGTYTTIDDPLARAGTFAEGINDPGTIVGYYVDAAGHTHGFSDSKGTFTTIDDPLGSGGTFALGINEPGQIVGYYIDGNGLRHGFIDSKGSFTTIDDPLGTKGTVAQSINDEGQIVGYYIDANGIQHGFRAAILPPANNAAAFDNDWTIAGTGQMGGNGLAGLVWENQNSNLVEIQLLNGTSSIGGGVISGSPFDANWRAAAVGDFNGDGMADIVYRRTSDGLTEIQFLNGTAAIGGGAIANNPFDKSWTIVAAADFNGDSRSDLVWQHQSDGLVEIQLLDGINPIGGGLIVNNPFGSGWLVAGAGDFNGDGKSDLVWQHQGDGRVEIQFLNGNQATGGGTIVNNAFGAGWNVVGVGDFNGDGKADLVWEHQGDHLVEIQLLNGTTAIGGGTVTNSPFGSDWRVIGTGDFNGDGKTDLVYRRVNDGLTEIQFLNGTTQLGGGVSSFGSMTNSHPGMSSDMFMQS